MNGLPIKVAAERQAKNEGYLKKQIAKRRGVQDFQLELRRFQDVFDAADGNDDPSGAMV